MSVLLARRAFSGMALFAARTKRGFSREQLARLVGVRAMTVYGWERRGGNPRANVVARMAQALGLEIADLFEPGGVSPPVEDFEG